MDGGPCLVSTNMTVITAPDVPGTGGAGKFTVAVPVQSEFTVYVPARGNGVRLQDPMARARPSPVKPHFVKRSSVLGMAVKGLTPAANVFVLAVSFTMTA